MRWILLSHAIQGFEYYMLSFKMVNKNMMSNDNLWNIESDENASTDTDRR
jgi:hypothetical protein